VEVKERDLYFKDNHTVHSFSLRQQQGKMVKKLCKELKPSVIHLSAERRSHKMTPLVSGGSVQQPNSFTPSVQKKNPSKSAGTDVNF